MSPPVSVFFTEEAGRVTAEKVAAPLVGDEEELVVAVTEDKVEGKEDVSLP